MRHALGTVRGKIALSVLSLAVISTVAGLAVFSAFTSTATTGANTFQAGTVDLSTNGTGTQLFDVTGMAPGDSSSSCVTVTYNGNLPAEVFLSGSELGFLGQYLQTSIQRGHFDPVAPSGNSCTGFVADQTGGLPPVDVAPSFSDTLDVLNEAGSIGLGFWTTDDSHVYKVTIGLPDGVSNDAQGLSASSTLTWTATNATP